VFEKRDAVLSVEEVLDRAIEAGATDVDVEDDGVLVVETEPSELWAVTQRLSESLGLKVESAHIIHDPKEDTLVALEEKDMAALETLLAQLEDDPAVLDVYVNAA
jgi:transcriptional/translational regulatory protein YebC/TACO1